MKRFLLSCVVITLGFVVVRSQGAVDVQIDVGANRHPIDAHIYGVAFADSASMADLRSPLNRWGGNATSRYNWQINAENRSADWYFESIGMTTALPGDDADTFVSQAKASGAEPLLTIPMVGWVAKLGANRNKLASFSIAKYGPQNGADTQYFPDAGSGFTPAVQPVTGNDPNDANVPASAAFQLGWMQHLVNKWGTSANGGVRYYALDNEPSIWQSTHRDVHPTGAKMDEIFNDALAYGAQLKAVDPGALIMGPEEWGWSAYFYSGYDQQWGATHGWNNLPDRTSHGNADYLPWFLDQLRQRNLATGQRLLDIFSVHFYPQGGQFGNDTSTTMQQLRNRSTRALWDPNYVDESWIGAPVMLVPRMKNWVSANYPGTKVAVTEYNWGAEGHINGATTQADILGIFGRESLDLATLWTTPAATSPTYKAIKLYRNYDGQGSSFGDTSVSAVSPNPDLLSAFAAQRGASGTLTIMAVNKDVSSPAVNFHLANFSSGGPVQVWQLTASNAITRMTDAVVSGSILAATLPAQSITLFAIPAASSAQAPGPPAGLKIVTGTGGGGASSISATGGTPQTTTVSTAFGTPLQATVRDASSNALSGISVTFTAPGSGAGGLFGGVATATTVSNANGLATAPPLTANAQTGSYTVTASTAGVASAAAFNLTNSAVSTGGGGVWTNVTPSGADLTNTLDCNNYGTITSVSDPARPSDFYTQFSCQGVWKSTNYGQTWIGPINTGSGASGVNGAGGLAIARGATGQPPILYSAGIRGTGIGFWKSTDGGVSWTNYNVAPGGSRQDFYPPVVDPYNGNHLLMNGHEMNLIVQSMDGGRTWTAVPMAGGMNENGGTGFLFFVNTGNAATTANTWLWIAQGTGGMVGTWRTTNGGNSWTRVDTNEHPHGEAQFYQPDTSGVIYMGGIYSALGWGVLRSADYGQTWVHVGSTSGEAVVFGTPNKVYAMYSGACGACTIDPALQIAPQPGITGWVSATTPPGMAMGPAQTAVVFDGSHYVIVTANWLSGLWRYVE